MTGHRWCVGALLVLGLAAGLMPATGGVAAAQPRTGAPSSPAPKPLDIPSSIAVAPGDGSAVVSWVAPADVGGAPVSGYTVTAQPGGQTAQVPGVARSATVTGLTNGVAYRFTVVATNRVRGRPS